MTDTYAPAGFVNFNDEMTFKLYVEKAGDSNSAPLDPLVAVQQFKAYPGKSLIGDPTVASHDYLSTWGLSDLSGGHGIHDHRAGMTDQRYRRATLAVDRPGAWTTQLLGQEISMGGEAHLIGELWDGSAMKMYASTALEVAVFDLGIYGGGGDFLPTGQSFAATPTKIGTEFMGKLFVPLQGYGYGIWDGTTAVSVAASGTKPDAVDFCLFGGTQLLCIDVDGQIWVTTDASNWEDIGVADGRPMKVQSSVRPRAIEEYRDGSGEPIAEVVTSGGVFHYDPAGPTLYRSGWRYPQHPYSGLASVVHDDVFNVSTGLDVRSLVPGSNSPKGLDRDDGLGAGMSRAYITSMASEYNGMWALVYAPDGGEYQVHRWDGLGWFEMWGTASDGTDACHEIAISGADGYYWAFWAIGQSVWCMALPISDTNVRTFLYDEGAYFFEPEGFIETGMTNHGMPGSTFTGVSFGLQFSWVAVTDFDGDPITPEVPVVKYRLRRDDDWTLCTPTFDPLAVVPASGETLAEGLYIWWLDEDFRGVLYKEIEFRIEAKHGVVIKWGAHYFMKQMAGSRGVDLVFDLSEQVGVHSPLAQRAYFDQMVESGYIQKMSYGRESIYVTFSQTSGNDKTGQHETRGIKRASVFEVKDRP